MSTAADEARAGHEQHGQHYEGHDPIVTIHVNNKPVFLHAGHYDVATLKKLSGVPLADDLDELMECKLKPIQDNATVKIRGREIFVSHVKDGGSS